MQMTFTPEQRDLIYAGRKTVHRIPAISACRYQEGRAYRVTVVGEDKPLVVTVVAPVTQQRLHEMRPRDALREGAKHMRDFVSGFVERHPELFDRSTPIHKQPEDWLTYVIEIAPGDLSDKPRFLASGGPAPVCKTPRRDVNGNVMHKPGSPIFDSKGAVVSERLVLCNRAFAIGQTVCACGAHRPPESADDYGYTTSHARAIDDSEALSDEDLKTYAWVAQNDADVLRDMPVRQGIGAAIEGVATLREAMRLMKGRNRQRVRLIEGKLKGIERELEKVGSELPSEAGV
jgi:hypothetical protein